MKTNFANAASPESRRLAELEKKKAALDRELYDARESVARSAHAYDPAPGLWDAGPGNWEPAEPESEAPPSPWEEAACRWEGEPGLSEAAPAYRDAAPSHSVAPPTRWDTAPTHNGARPTHRDATPTRNGAPPSRWDGAPTRNEGDPSHWDTAPTHNEAPSSRWDAAPTHNGAQPRRRDATPAHNGAPRKRRDAAPIQNEAPPIHWDTTPSHSEAAPGRWDTGQGHTEAPPGHWDAARSHNQAAPGQWDGAADYDPQQAGPHQADPEADDPGYGDDGAALALPPRQVDGYRGDHAVEDDLISSEQRTAILINHGRASASRKRVAPIMKVAGTTAVVLAAVVGLVVLMLPGPGPAWPSGVAKVQAEITKACLNPDVSSEPGQVNFACGRSTRQILWIFALLTSHNNPSYAQAKTGRVGLEPISPTQGGVVAWSLNLHHPYDPTDPIDSIEVAARAINNIIGGATVTSSLGNPVIQAGLEGHAANCLRYTGSAKVVSHKGYPDLCAQPVSSAAGQAALVTDVYQRWVVGASPKAAQTAATLFENSRNPASPQVQAILKALPNANR